MDLANTRLKFWCAALALALYAGPGKAEQAPQAVQWSQGATQVLDGACGQINLEGIEDGQTYTLWVKSPASATCSFRASGLTFRYPPNYGPTTPGHGALFSFTRFGADVLVSWAPGY